MPHPSSQDVNFPYACQQVRDLIASISPQSGRWQNFKGIPHRLHAAPKDRGSGRSAPNPPAWLGSRLRSQLRGLTSAHRLFHRGGRRPVMIVKIRRPKSGKEPEGDGEWVVRAGRRMPDLPRKSRWESACKPGSVGDSHSSGTHVAVRLKRPTRGHARAARRGARPLVPLFGLAPGGVYPATGVTVGAVRSYRTISPLPIRRSG